MHTLFQQHAASEAVIHIPQINTGYTALKVPARVSYHDPAMATSPPPACNSQFSIDVKSLVCLDLHLTDTITRRDTLVNGRLELVAPRTAPAVTVAVVVAAQKVALRL